MIMGAVTAAGALRPASFDSGGLVLYTMLRSLNGQNIVSLTKYKSKDVFADVAQLVEQRFCKPLVGGSSPFVGLFGR